MLIKQLFNERIIPFPKELWLNGSGDPYLVKNLLGITAAAMLYPEDEKGFSAYVAKVVSEQALEAENNLTMLLKNLKYDSARLPEAEVKVQGQSVEEEFHKLVTETDQRLVQWQRDLFGSPVAFFDSVQRHGFKKSGKGSIDVRIIHGRICGLIFFIRAMCGLSLHDSINEALKILKEWCEKSDDDKNDMPMLVYDNIDVNIWPRFRNSAWLWSSFFFVSPEYDEQCMDLENTAYGLDPFTSAFGVNRFGWMGFIDFALKIFEFFYKDDTSFRKYNDLIPWRFSFQIQSSHEE